MKATFVVKRDNPKHMAVVAFACQQIHDAAVAGDELVIKVDELTRTLPQNDKMWAMLTDIANQVGWHRARWRGDRCLEDGHYVNLEQDPRATQLTTEEFKDVLTAALVRPRMFGSIDGGGIVAVGLRTSKMKKAKMRELIELIYAFGSQHEVEWTEVVKDPIW